MGLVDILKSLMQKTKKINVKDLPSRGIFYKKDFSLKIKKAEIQDIVEYELNFDKENLFAVVESIKKIVKKNIVLDNNYTFDDVKSVDVCG
jgi:hypothetical protein